jgi:uncharacterized phage protein gp47/JayE
MPNIITDSGIQTKTLEEIVASIVDGESDALGLRQIYGRDINIDSDTPDGQLVNIFALAVKDVLDLATQVYNSFDPDFAVGRILDQRCAINGIERQGATYTEIYVDVTVNRALTLPGLDDSTSTPFTVRDAEGNKFLLKNTKVFDAAGTDSLDFRAEESGSIRALPRTINRQVTITLGVTAVNNPSSPTIIGQDEESDYDLRIRRARALALPATGTADGILSSLLDVKDVSEAIVYENISNETDGDDIPGHSIWCIVAGGSDKDIAEAIYLKRNAGCGMKGGTEVAVEQADHTLFEVLFDRPEPQYLWIKFKTATIDNDSSISATAADYLRAELIERLHYSIHQTADITTITKMAREIMPDVIIHDAYVSGDKKPYADPDKKWSLRETPETKRHRFILEKSHIVIDGEAGSDAPGNGEPEDNPENENE